MYFEVPLTRDRVARVDCAIERLDPHIVRCALGDNNISVPGTFIICFGVKEAGKVLKPEAIPVSSIKSVTRSPMGLIALQLDDDRMVIPTVPRDYHPAIVESLLRLAQQTPEKPRRLFFARVNEELLLIDANEVCKLPKKLDERPSRPSAAPDEAS